ncbi:hypothetical protein MTO96_051325 [Rhipicephalus appendiculatus]
MQDYAIMLLAAFVCLFCVLYMAPLVQTAAHTVSLALVVVVASHCAAVWLLKMLTYKGVPPKGKIVVIARCDSGYGNRLALELDRRGFTVVAGCVSEGSSGSRLLKEYRNIHVVDTDVTQTESLAEFEKYVRALCKDGCHLWAVIINLSAVSLGELEWHNDDDMCWTHERLCDANCSRFVIYVVGIEPNLYRLPQTEPSSLLKSYKYMWNKLPGDVKDIYSRDYADEMEENIRRTIATEPDPIVLDVAKMMLDAVQTAYPSKVD